MLREDELASTREARARTRLWRSGGTETWLPPAEAVYFGTEFLDPRAYTAFFGIRSRLPFGNPDLKPERVTRGLFAIGAEIFPEFWLRFGLEGLVIEDAITPHAYPVYDDSLVYYINGGKRDLIDFSVRATWEPSSRFRARVSYDLSRMRTETVEPIDLLATTLSPELPAAGTDQGEGLPLFYPTYDDGRDRGFFPSIFDRRHRIAFALVSHTPPDLIGESGRVIFTDLDVGLLARITSGAPFTQTEVYPAGLLTEADPPSDASGSSINEEQTDWTFRLDLRVSRTIRFWSIASEAFLEVTNLTNKKNARIVYPATGKGDDDQYLSSAGAPSDFDFTNAYRARIQDSIHYEDPRLLRAGIRLRFR